MPNRGRDLVRLVADPVRLDLQLQVGAAFESELMPAFGPELMPAFGPELKNAFESVLEPVRRLPEQVDSRQYFRFRRR